MVPWDDRVSAARRTGRLVGRGWRVGRRVAPFTLPSLLLGLLLAASAGVGTAVIRTVEAPYRTGEPMRLEVRPLAERSTIYAGDGSVLGYLHADENRVTVPLDAVPVHLQDAVIAIEDADFYQHDGVDVAAVFRALFENLNAGAVVQGASTITQQLAKLERGSASRDVWTKAREAGLALNLERQLGKRRILERYLNAAYFGHGTYGVAAAGELYFGKPIGDLDVGESALLAGVIASPTKYDPMEQPDAARARRAVVLKRMVASGRLDAAQVSIFSGAPLPAELHRVNPPESSRYFVEEVKRRLLRDPRLGATPQDRYDGLFRGGLHIRTTIDPVLQGQAESAVRERLPDSPFTAALVAVDPATGEVKALVGGPGFEEAKFNLATQGARQTGSAFKMVTLVAALENGYSPDDLVDGTAPCELPQEHDDEPWRVDNYDGPGGEVVPLHEALARSLNCAFARLVIALGPDEVVDTAHRLGVERELDAFPSVTLGAEEVSPLEMATVAATLAAEGVHRPPLLVRRVETPDGEVLVEEAPGSDEAVDSQTVRLATQVLRGVIEHGTGRRAAIGRPAAGKTGTAQRWRDAWFVGYTPQLAAAVWMGSPVGEVSMEDVGGIHVTGGSFPAQIWATFMRRAHDGLPVLDFTAPDLTVLPPPGLIDITGRGPLPTTTTTVPEEEPGSGPGNGKKGNGDGGD